MSRKAHRTSRQRFISSRPSGMPSMPTAAASAPTAEKVNPAFFGVTMFNDVPQPHTMPRNYKNYADQGYAANDSVHKCIKYIIQNGAAIPVKLYTDASKATEIPNHPLLDRLARPNNEQDGVSFREAILGWYLVTGNAFIYAIRPGAPAAASHSIKGPPDELWVLEANKVHPQPSPTRGIESYKFDDFDDAHNPIPAANIGHLRTWNPKDPIFGLSTIEVAALMIDQQNAMRKWQLALTSNMGKPSGAWIVDAPLDKNARDRLEDRINEKISGARNAGRIPVIDAGAKWQPTSLAPSELDWIESLKYNAGIIANLYDIPPQIIGDTSATTYNNMKEAKAASYTEAIFPALDKLFSLLTMWLVPMYPDLADAKGNATACLTYDKSTVEVVQEVIQDRENARADRASKLYFQGAITLNQAQVMLGLPDLGAKGDVYRLGAVLVPADKLDDYAEQSLTEPAKPPIPQPETPAGLPAVPPAPATDPTAPPAEPPEPEPEPPPPAKPGKKAGRATKAAGDSVTHLLWECDDEACEFCLQNDGVIIEADEDGDPIEPFPNGCTSPDDSHRFCKCRVQQLSVPPDEAETLTTGASGSGGATIGSAAQRDAAMAATIAAFAIGVIPSRHAADVAAQQQRDNDDDADDDDEGEEDAEDQTGATYAAPAKPKPKPKPGEHVTRKQSRVAYRRWMEEVT